MNRPTVCIANRTTGVRDCTLADEHYPDCAAPRCRGCRPRPAKIGFVCGTCFDHIESAVRTAEQFYADRADLDRAKNTDSTGAHVFGPGIPIPPVPLSLDEVRSYHASFTGTAERWVHSQAGARDAVRFAAALAAAERAHPIAETKHEIRRTRCPRCSKRTLVWHPPQYVGGRVQILCRDQTCKFEADQTSYENIADIEERDSKRAGDDKPRPHNSVPVSCSRCGEPFQHRDLVIRLGYDQRTKMLELEHAEHYAA